MSDTPPRIEALRTAAGFIDGARDAQYGSPMDNFTRIAKLWSAAFDREFTAEEVAQAMILSKISRFGSKSGFQADTWIDIAGYAGCGYEVAMREHGAETPES